MQNLREIVFKDIISRREKKIIRNIFWQLRGKIILYFLLCFSDFYFLMQLSDKYDKFLRYSFPCSCSSCGCSMPLEIQLSKSERFNRC